MSNDPVINTPFGSVRRADVMALLTDPEDLAEINSTPGLLEAFAGALLDSGEIQPIPTSENSKTSICCGGCQYFRPDTIGDSSGIGNCAINAPKSRRHPPSERYPIGYSAEMPLYPNAERHCDQFNESDSI